MDDNRMQFYINSERYLSNVAELSVRDILNMSGYPIYKNYKVIDEISKTEYLNLDDQILIKNNLSLVIIENREMFMK